MVIFLGKRDIFVVSVRKGYFGHHFGRASGSTEGSTMASLEIIAHSLPKSVPSSLPYGNDVTEMFFFSGVLIKSTSGFVSTKFNIPFLPKPMRRKVHGL